MSVRALHYLPLRVIHSRVIEILIQGVKKLQPEEIARKIQQFDQDLCTQLFLSELKRVLPTPEQVCTFIRLRATLMPCDRRANLMSIETLNRKNLPNCIPLIVLW